jgi:hypothetical protein
MKRNSAKVGNIDYLQETCNKTALDLGGDSDKKNSSHFTTVLLKVRKPPFFVLGHSRTAKLPWAQELPPAF